MMVLALATLLAFQDPRGDTVGNGTLAAPTAAVFRDSSSFDLTSLELLDEPTLTLRLTFAALPNPLNLPNGFSLPIAEVYIGDETPGSSTLLPGSGMRLPDAASWHYAFKLTGDRVQVFIADGGTVTELGAADGLELSVLDNALTLQTPLPRPEQPTLYALVGAYSPFSDSGWQNLSSLPAPWAFSSTEQTVPVVDVLADNADVQAQAVDTQVLPGLRRAAPPAAPQENRWLLLVAGGVVVVLVGMVGRFTVPKPQPRTGLPPEVYEQAKTAQPAAAPLGELAVDADLAAETLTPSSTETDAAAEPELEPVHKPATEPETADLEAWVANAPNSAGTNARAKEPIPEVPVTYPPGTGPELNEPSSRREFPPTAWLEWDEDDTELWAARAGDATGEAANDTDVKHS